MAGCLKPAWKIKLLIKNKMSDSIARPHSQTNVSDKQSASVINTDQPQQILWKINPLTVALLCLAVLLAIWAYADGLLNLVARWEAEEEYNHGYFLPLMTLIFLWQVAPKLARENSQPSWAAVLLAAIALLMFVIGELSAIYLLIHYSFIMVLLALSLAVVGWKGTRLTLVPIGLLIFAVPIPYFLESAITSKLQLISSKLGVDIIRLCKIPVFREGNLIDLGTYKLEVVEACSGLTYLYPLLGFGVICAYMYKAEFWKKLLLVLSTIPIAILLNSFRIGMIGFLVKYFGDEQATGFLHAFEGFAVFMVCVAILFVEMWLLTFVGQNRRPFGEVFGLNFEPVQIALKSPINIAQISKPLIVTVLMIASSLALISVIGNRQEIKPDREYFASFPTEIAGWRGQQSTLESGVLETLDLSDYVLIDFTGKDAIPVNFYVAYYASQRKGSSPHSPTVCLPGSGWQILDFKRQILSVPGNPPFEYNRALIGKGNDRQLVYYWFLERGKPMADEYQVKWQLFKDAIFKNRTDGALVRVITPVASNESIDKADQRIKDLLKGTLPLLPAYIPL